MVRRFASPLLARLLAPASRGTSTIDQPTFGRLRARKLFNGASMGAQRDALAKQKRARREMSLYVLFLPFVPSCLPQVFQLAGSRVGRRGDESRPTCGEDLRDGGPVKCSILFKNVQRQGVCGFPFSLFGELNPSCLRAFPGVFQLASLLLALNLLLAPGSWLLASGFCEQFLAPRFRLG